MAEAPAAAGTTTATTTTTAPAEDPTTTEPAKPEPTSDDLKAALTKAHKEAEAHRKAAEAAAAKVKEYEDEKLTEKERADARAKAAEEKADKAEKDLLRLKVGTAKGLPPDLAERLKGDTEAEMEADAEVVAKHLAPATHTPSIDGGARGGPLALNGDPLLADVNRKLGIR